MITIQGTEGYKEKKNNKTLKQDQNLNVKKYLYITWYSNIGKQHF